MVNAEIFTITRPEVTPPKFQTIIKPLEIINTLTQPRRDFSVEETQILAQDIAIHGLYHLPTLARFNPETMEEYLSVINQIWGSNHKLEEQKSVLEDEQTKYYVLISGERRLKALKMLVECGYDEYRETEFRFREGPPRLHLETQFTENLHVAVPPHQQAVADINYFKYRRIYEKGYSLTQLSQDIGRARRTLKESMRYFNLPTSIQSRVEEGMLPYGIAVELARLQEVGLNEQNLHRWATKALIAKLKVPEFKQQVSNYINSLHSSQTSLLDLMTEQQKAQLETPQYRQVVARKYLEYLQAERLYQSMVLTLYERGELGDSNSKYSDAAPRREIEADLKAYQKRLGLLEWLLPATAIEEGLDSIETHLKIVANGHISKAV